VLFPSSPLVGIPARDARTPGVASLSGFGSYLYVSVSGHGCGSWHEGREAILANVSFLLLLKTKN
jgi:hypothetical protein